MSEKITGDALAIVSFLMGDNIDKKAIWDLSLHREKRSLSQNGYYWVLAGKVAQKTGISTARIHNMHLRELHLLERIDGKVVTVFIPDTDEAENNVLESATYHLAPTDGIRVGNDGITYRGYVMLKGSSDMTTDEMSALLNFMIQDAEAQGISVMTPNELSHLRELEKANEKHNPK